MAKSRKTKAPPKRPPNRPGPPTPPPPPVTADTPLDEHERRFVEEYLIDRIAGAAYRRTFPNVTYHSSYHLGVAMRDRPNVRAEINAGLHAQRIRSRVTADKVVDELARIAFSDVYALYDEASNQLRHPRHIPYDVRKAIASIKVTRRRTTTTRRGQTTTTTTDALVEYRLWNKVDALDKLMSHLGLKKAEIPPLDALLALLPPPLREQLRVLMTEQQIRSPSTNGKHT